MHVWRYAKVEHASPWYYVPEDHADRYLLLDPQERLNIVHEFDLDANIVEPLEEMLWLTMLQTLKRAAEETVSKSDATIHLEWLNTGHLIPIG